ncbi:MAG: TlpA family protein disulfide reductase [Flavobacteriales bacterium]|nr:TlpA family protein disulfide reductase [Flavobacteriales bacterium]
MKLLSTLLLGLILSFSSPSNFIEKNSLSPEIVLNNTKGVEVRLSSLHGKIVLIDFWASWCRPCRTRHPELVSVYNQFKDSKFKKGSRFDLFSVSLDKNKEAWLRAIKQDKLTWKNHVSDLKGWNSDVVKTYDVRGIPMNVLIDENGKIIATNLYGDQLRKVLTSLL